MAAQAADLRFALDADVRAALASGPIRAYLALQLVSATFLVVRRGPGMLVLLGIIGAGALVFGLLAWEAGRMPGAHPARDLVRAPRAEMALVAVGYVALSGQLVGWWPSRGWPPASTVLAAAFAGWLFVVLAAWLRDARRGRSEPLELGWIFRTWLPFWPLIALLVLFKLPAEGVALLGSAWAGLGSGVVQQILLQVGLTARLEAFLGRPDAAAVLGAVAFGAAHVSMNLPQAGGDWWIAAANAAVLQTTIGLVFCAAYLRHRAPLPLGVCHALLMA